MVSKTSNQLIRDFYKGQLKRMHKLVYFMVVLILINIAGLGWVLWNQHQSNNTQTGIINTLQKYVEQTVQNQAVTNAKIEDSHAKLFKAMACLLILHDSHAITDPTVSLEECQKTANEISSMATSPAQTTPVQNQPSIPADSNPQPKAASGGPSQPPSQNLLQKAGGAIMNIVHKVTDLL